MRARVGEAAEIWRGGVNTWECDEMGHLNVRFYVARAMEGLAGLARLLGMPLAFSGGASAGDGQATLIVREHHIRFLREARPGTALHMTGGVLEFGASGARLVQVLLHSRTGEPCAAVLTRVDHATGDGRVFPWPRRARVAAEAMTVALPSHAAPRGIDPNKTLPVASLARADQLGLRCIGRGALLPADCDAFGRMRPEQFIGRVSDGVPSLLSGVREAASAAGPQPPKRVGGAVLEYRLIYLELPRAGDHIEIRSGLAGFDDKTQRLAHWLLDPVSGKPWGVSEAVAISFDLDARKAIPIAPEMKAVLERFVVSGLA